VTRHLRSVDKSEFKRVCGRFATGVTIASVLDAAGTPHGLTVNSFTSVSLAPPLVLICLGHEASVINYFRTASHFAINVLAEDQKKLSDRFARKGHDRFDGLAWRPGHTGVPLIDDVLATIECSLHQRFTAGDHDIFVGEVLHTRVRDDARPLLYYASHYRTLA
jgi:flavin reductase (DIM6/NTAB) family NADH-FMN oxidoreductase RutF